MLEFGEPSCLPSIRRMLKNRRKFFIVIAILFILLASCWNEIGPRLGLVEAFFLVGPGFLVLGACIAGWVVWREFTSRNASSTNCPQICTSSAERYLNSWRDFSGAVPIVLQQITKSPILLAHIVAGGATSLQLVRTFLAQAASCLPWVLSLLCFLLYLGTLFGLEMLVLRKCLTSNSQAKVVPSSRVAFFEARYILSLALAGVLLLNASGVNGIIAWSRTFLPWFGQSLLVVGVQLFIFLLISSLFIRVSLASVVILAENRKLLASFTRSDQLLKNHFFEGARYFCGPGLLGAFLFHTMPIYLVFAFFVVGRWAFNLTGEFSQLLFYSLQVMLPLLWLSLLDLLFLPMFARLYFYVQNSNTPRSQEAAPAPQIAESSNSGMHEARTEIDNPAPRQPADGEADGAA